MTEWDLKCMRLAIQVAKIFPDPVRGKAVGAILAHDNEDQDIVAIGYRQTYFKGEGYLHNCIHAEDMALRTVRDAECELTLYVTMEPCRIRLKHETWVCHDSCTKQIIESDRIKRVVFGCRDLKYGGTNELAAAGIKVEYFEDFEMTMECVNLATKSIIPIGQEENLRQAEENARLGDRH